MTIRLIAHTAPMASGLSAAGTSRSIAKTIAVGQCTPAATLRARAEEIARINGAVGKVHARGTWQEPPLHGQLAQVLGALMALALRADFEWYTCRGAFFHNDAHYDARLFGVWCIAGSPMEIVFPRAALRVATAPGTLAIFDPFEVHGVLVPGHDVYAASDYETAESTVFIGFEVDITPDVADAFGVQHGVHGRVISSRTRIDSASGAID